MSKRVVIASAAHFVGRIKELAAAVKANFGQLETRIGMRSIIVSDVFGADIAVAKNAAASSMQPERASPVRWDDGIEFAPAQRDRSSYDFVALNSATASHVHPVPSFLTRPRGTVSHGSEIEVSRHLPIIRHLPKLVCAAIILLVWITASRSGPILQVSHSSADAIAERFAGAGEGLLDDQQNTRARLQFAPRFELFYADDLKDGLCALHDGGGGIALQPLRDAATVMIRNLPSGTVLSKGERVTDTDWQLKPEELKEIAVRIPADYGGPVKATIETLDGSGGVLGNIAVEIRETSKEPRPRIATQKRITVGGSNKIAVKRRQTTGAQPLVAKPTLASEAPAPTSPAEKQPLPLLLFLPGSYDKNAPPSVSVNQQILINLGVSPDVPQTIAQKN